MYRGSAQEDVQTMISQSREEERQNVRARPLEEKRPPSNVSRLRISDKSYMVQRLTCEVHQKISKRYARGRLLDIGCGAKSKRDLFIDVVDEYIGLDHVDSPHGLQHVDVIATAYDTLQPLDSFDTILCTAVLEHLEEPEKALKEAFRILKPGGYAIYTAPLFWHLHEEPRDFYRFTKHGLRYLFEKTGFDIEVLYPCGGFWITLGSEFNYYLDSFSKSPFRLIFPFLQGAANLLCLSLDRMHKAERFTWAYLVVARKPAL
jgi:SAM-dependent methyltransferase